MPIALSNSVKFVFWQTTLFFMNRIYKPTGPIPKKISGDNYEKGKAFEEFVINLFNKHSFHLKEWRQAQKFIDTSLPMGYFNPDLELELVFTGKGKYRFAVECKWRKDFSSGKIRWAKKHQIVAYEKFQSERRIPVFIAIGIGGEPANPGRLYVTPLVNISNNIEVCESQLIPFSRKPTRKFFYDIKQLVLF